uniref:t-SNARE coiled-coil homology domain-containing protein n=1 Tax=Chromera velia CCMP2878 TaxID=1169474 RepID=A0A0G4FKF0_9ALVE|eukprot:Cvel_17458.t1-p1 / transcript=Cvel_17458.t1 / gene=Cvel_17458 / organism=Chromera_velia_CCMP2878 / gene_product=hypothetical protein / transcript_product=hypothetical protein / location=Cvel_scaffold1394:16751-18532(-) / protein_length=594 / sequence_SO=supercontig / SO=protein_coding / is_pseudo=false
MAEEVVVPDYKQLCLSLQQLSESVSRIERLCRQADVYVDDRAGRAQWADGINRSSSSSLRGECGKADASTASQPQRNLLRGPMRRQMHEAVTTAVTTKESLTEGFQKAAAALPVPPEQDEVFRLEKLWEDFVKVAERFESIVEANSLDELVSGEGGDVGQLDDAEAYAHEGTGNEASMSGEARAALLPSSSARVSGQGGGEAAQQYRPVLEYHPSDSYFPPGPSASSSASPQTTEQKQKQMYHQQQNRWEESPLEVELARERAAEALKVARDAAELREIQGHLAAEVSQQGDSIEGAGETIERTELAAKGATVQLAMASKKKSKGWTWRGGGVGAVAGGLIGCAFGPVGAAVGATLGGGVGVVGSSSLQKAHSKKMDTIVEKNAAPPPPEDPRGEGESRRGSSTGRRMSAFFGNVKIRNPFRSTTAQQQQQGDATSSSRLGSRPSGSRSFDRAAGGAGDSSDLFEDPENPVVQDSLEAFLDLSAQKRDPGESMPMTGRLLVNGGDRLGVSKPRAPGSLSPSAGARGNPFETSEKTKNNPFQLSEDENTSPFQGEANNRVTAENLASEGREVGHNEREDSHGGAGPSALDHLRAS